MKEVKFRFFKYQGLGNDFVLIDLHDCAIPDPAELSRRLCDRHCGVGADGVILVAPHPTCAARVEFYNLDGSRAQMCGNGIRCVARYLRNTARKTEPRFSIMTDAGIRGVGFVPEGVCVSLGEPSFSPRAIPALLDPEVAVRAAVTADGFPDLPPATCLSLGNPHCVLWVADLEHFPVAAVGSRIERLPVFPERINVEFAQRIGPDRIACRVWERGAGETRACGTGAAATLVAATLLNLVPGEAMVVLPGGELQVSWKDRRDVTIAGRAEEVFRGSMALPPSLIARSSPAPAFPRRVVQAGGVSSSRSTGR
jgi:diaminopimelate epimerase